MTLLVSLALHTCCRSGGRSGDEQRERLQSAPVTRHNIRASRQRRREKRGNATDDRKEATALFSTGSKQTNASCTLCSTLLLCAILTPSPRAALQRTMHCTLCWPVSSSMDGYAGEGKKEKERAERTAGRLGLPKRYKAAHINEQGQTQGQKKRLRNGGEDTARWDGGRKRRPGEVRRRES